MFVTRYALTFVILLAVATGTTKDHFPTLKPISAYELRKDVLMLPRYAENGEVCEIGFEKRHYSPEMVFLDSGFSRDEIDSIFEELVPANERGKKIDDFWGDLILESGHGLTTTIGYENVSLRIMSEKWQQDSSGKPVLRDVVVIIRWKGRECK